MEFHPLAATYPLMPEADLDRLRSSIREGFNRIFPIVRFEGMILDGRNRYLACVAENVDPFFVDFRGTADEARQFVIDANEHRRHLTQKWLTQRRTERIHQITEMRRGGASTRQIAEAVGVSQTQVANDLKVAATEQGGCSAETPTSEQGGCSVAPTNGVVIGKDKKKRKSTGKKKPKTAKVVYLCQRCSRIGIATCKPCKEKKNPVPDPRALAPPPSPAPDVDREPGVEASDEAFQDSEGHDIPGPVAEAFLAPFGDAVSLCQKLQGMVDKIACGPGGTQLARFVSPRKSGEKVVQRSKHLDALKQDLKGTRPHSVCPYCKGKRTGECKGCSGAGWVTKTTWDGCDNGTKARLAK